MRSFFLFIFVTSFGRLNADQISNKKYFIVDRKSSAYQLNIVKLNGNGKQKIELYNLMYDGSNLLLFSVLPLKDDVLWTEIDTSKIKNQIIDFNSVI